MDSPITMFVILVNHLFQTTTHSYSVNANVDSTYAIKSTLFLSKPLVYTFSNNGMVNNIIWYAILGNNNLLMVIRNIERVIVKINILRPVIIVSVYVVGNWFCVI